MAEKLTLRNFGPIKKAEIEVTDMMVFIGAQSSGKSTLAKLITILNDFNFRQNYGSELIKELEKYNLSSFINKNTYINYDSPFFRFKYEKGEEEKFEYSRILNYFLNKKEHKKDDIETIELIIGIMISIIVSDEKSDILLREIQKDNHFGLIENPESLLEINSESKQNYSLFPSHILKKYNKDLNLSELNQLARQVIRVFSFIRPLDSMYVPAERTLIPLIVNNIAGLINNKISFPQYMLQAVQEFEKGLNTINSFSLDIIGSLRYKRTNNQSYIYHNKNQKVLLKEASSGVQSILPILLLIESSVRKENYINLNYVVEEPELNLYPEAQYELSKYLVKSCLETELKVQTKNLIITTHSPYILASINNLLLAHKKGTKNKKLVDEIVKESSWINPKNFNAYEVKNGTVQRIFNKKNKLIEDNIIDEVTEIIMEDFKKLALIND
ncbi:AAA family ATPase [uncultured Maribacter sp.]|uniref:AAA family ATPase n=1 Tax=uncultured Maribacter sp. TaxID=431308 RepID=UPI002603F2A6|nr:AAA family ATPase [uncultured Maribacter sp.]